jgi:hypothetical protein
MEKTIIAGVAALLLSAGAAVAQSNSDQNTMNAGTSATAGASSAMPSKSAPDSATAPKKARTAAAHYPKGEAKLNREEAQQTKELNLQQSQAVASNSGAGNSTAMNSSSADTSASTGMNSGAASSGQSMGSSSQPQ